MVAPVDPYIVAFAEAGADIITVHAEAGPHTSNHSKHKKPRKEAGLSLNPATPASAIDNLIDQLDLILVMTVNPGFGGQKFIENQIDKIQEIRRRIDESGRTIDLEVDGGSTRRWQNGLSAGADVLVAGTASFRGGAEYYKDNISQLRASK